MGNPMFQNFNQMPSGDPKLRPNPLDLSKQNSEVNGQLNPKRFSIFVKNVPHDKFKIESVCDFFKQFGEVTNVNLDSRKNACTIKFKEIVSAEKAADYAAANIIWNDMNVKVIYNTMAPPKVPGAVNPLAKPAQPGAAPTPSPEEEEEQKQLQEMKKLIERKRQNLLDKLNSDIKRFVKQLGQEGLTED
jgi:RNA recognition motif-containing protein